MKKKHVTAALGNETSEANFGGYCRVTTTDRRRPVIFPMCTEGCQIIDRAAFGGPDGPVQVIRFAPIQVSPGLILRLRLRA